jgi:hypothetical protein
VKKKIIIASIAAVIVIFAAIAISLLWGDRSINLPIDGDNITADHEFGDSTDVLNPAPFIPLSINELLAVQTPRGDYVLAPTKTSLTGIDTLSAFVLRTSEGFNDSFPTVSIDGQPEPIITREDDNTFIITPAIPLTSNALHVVRIESDDGDITWAFQTMVHFEIASTLPRNQSTNVPVRTGIEINFSQGENLDIADFFGIFPHVEGEFMFRNSTAVFMPSSPLAFGQVYTVTIQEGISLPGTSEIISQDYIFSFETAPESDSMLMGNTSIHFNSYHVEFPSFSAPSVSFWLNYDRDRTRPAIEMDVYRIDDRVRAIDATNHLASVPNWTRIPQENRLVDISGLRKVHSTRYTGDRDDNWWYESFELPIILPPGFYVFNASADGSVSQMIIQITDLAVQVIADEDKAIVWLSDMTTGAPASGARVFDPLGGKTYEATTYGIAVVERMLSTNEYLIVTAADGKESVVFMHLNMFQHFGWGRRWSSWDSWGWNPWSSLDANSRYWSVLQLDRTLFQRSDTVSLWGFVQNRRQDEEITHVTAVLTERSWWWEETGRDTLHRVNIPVINGAYSGDIRLPHLDPGSYELTVYHGDAVLNTIFVSVMDYVKPPYQLNTSADKTAIFAGEEVTFTARTEFFEGTPVPDLDISYYFWGWNLTMPPGGSSQTNNEGVVELTVSPAVSDAERSEWNRVQGESGLSFMAEATLPEIGWTHQWESVRVFINDIEMKAQASRTGRDASLSVSVHNITLDRLNDGTAENWADYLDTPKAGQRISVEIVEYWWERIQDGTWYDFVTRQNLPRYRHEQRERVLERFDITTDAEGNAERAFTVPNTDKRSYQARISTTDGNGRSVRHDVFIGYDHSWFFDNAGNDLPFLYGVNPDGYDLGDKVELTIMSGTEPLTQGNFLFVVVQDGILSYHIGKNTLSFAFGERHVPNTQVYAYHFNGHTYHTNGSMSAHINYNALLRKLNVEVTSCRDVYKPGDMVTITVSATDEKGTPKAANVNISLVDEALFALMDYSADTLAMLYRNVNTGLRVSMATHRTFISDGIEEYGEMRRAAGGGDAALSPSATHAPEALDTANDSGGGGGDARIRERFEDTATFISLRTDSRGLATYTFRLPDNITSWRMTASGISDDLYAGNIVRNVRVTLPIFLHYALGSTFLVGDAPYLGVNVYGTSLFGSERVVFEVWRENAPEDIRRAEGVSFERVNIPFWEMTEEGFGDVIIRATVDNGLSDAVRHSYQVVGSYRMVDVTRFYEVTPDTVFDINTSGQTNITFTDRGRGLFLGDLFSLRNIWRSGARLEGLVSQREATNLLKRHFPDVRLFDEGGSFDVSDYQTENGGIAILPYANADLQTTVMLIPFIKDEINQITLRDYLWNIANGASVDDIALALYGLALLGEPVLLDLQAFAKLPDLSVRNAAYTALGLAAIGESFVAREIYVSSIAPHIQRISPYYRVNIGSTRTEILNATSVTALLAARLGMPEAMGLHEYTVNYRYENFDREDPYRSDVFLLMNIERLLFITYEIGNRSNAEASITYTLFGETIARELGFGGQFTLRIPAQNMNEFNLVSTTGEVGAVSIIRTPLNNPESIGSDVTIRREFFKSGSNTRTTAFDHGDLVRVQITVDYSAVAMNGSYIITDFLPAGLAHVAYSARIGNELSTLQGRWAFAATDGQRITFYDYNSRFDRVNTYYYYARVISPGTFKAEGTLVQSVGVREYMTVGADATITIRAN